MSDDMERLRERARRESAEQERQKQESHARRLVEIKKIAQRDLPTWKKAIEYQMKNFKGLSLITVDADDHREVATQSFFGYRRVPVAQWANGSSIVGFDAEMMLLYAAELGGLLGEPFRVTAYPPKRERVVTSDIPYPHTDYSHAYIAVSW